MNTKLSISLLFIGLLLLFSAIWGGYYLISLFGDCSGCGLISITCESHDWRTIPTIITALFCGFVGFLITLGASAGLLDMLDNTPPRPQQ